MTTNTLVQTEKPDSLPIPDFCRDQNLLIMVVVTELIAIVISLSQQQNPFFVQLAYVSLFMQIIVLLDAALLCYGRKLLQQFAPRVMLSLIYLLLQLITLIVTLLAYWILEYLDLTSLVTSLANMLVHNLLISSILTAIVMRYLYLQQQNYNHLQAMNLAKIQALQNRIRPHFLFNSLNTIANLINIQPEKAENAVLDLADLLRFTLAEHQRISLAAELAVCQHYLNLEQLRLGERLHLDWQLAPEVNTAQEIPPLILQPLLENAVYHGIEPLSDGGTIKVRIQQQQNKLLLQVINPVIATRKSKTMGNGIAINNIRQRLKLIYAAAATLTVTASADLHQVDILLPLE